MHPLLRSEADPTPRIAVIDGSTGLRRLLASFVKHHFPNAAIEDVDPFSQTLRGAVFSVGARGDAIVLGGVGTEKEANDALNRLRSQPDCPPIVMLVADALIVNRASFIAAGASDVLRKDALSSHRLRRTLISAMNADKANFADGNKATTRIISPPPSYAKYTFIVDGERVALDIDGYRFLSLLASGPLAQVFFAEGIDSGKRVAIKIMTSVSLHAGREIAQMCDISARLRPLRARAVVDEVDAGIVGTFPYVVMEFLSHGDLRRRFKTRFSVAESVAMLQHILLAATQLHSRGVCHADLKPESIFFRPDGSVTLIDFNISVPFGQSVRYSAFGDVLGTPTYMSPEQGAGGPVDAKSDLYSAGVIFYEALTGVPPFVGDTPAQTIYRHLHDEIPLLPTNCRHLQPVVDQLLAKTASERFADADTAIAALTALHPTAAVAGRP
jgi:eukaryotic-like serine/threonine-protein kinase